MRAFLTGSNSETAIFHNLQRNQCKDKSNIEISQCGTKNSQTNLTGSATISKTADSHEKNVSRPTDNTIVQDHCIKNEKTSKSDFSKSNFSSPPRELPPGIRCLPS